VILIIFDLILIGCSDHSVKLWKYYPSQKTAEFMQLFIGHSGNITALNWVQKEFRLFTASLDGTARLWNIETGRCTQIQRNDGAGYLAAASSPSKIFFACLTATQTIEILTQSDLHLLYVLPVFFKILEEIKGVGKCAGG